jgi:hypothetical protein
MAGKIIIQHPKEGETIKFASFSVSGITKDGPVGFIKGVLNGQDVKYNGNTLSTPPPSWVVFFENVAQGDYELVVSGTEAGVEPARRRVKVRPTHKIGIVSPQRGDRLCLNFTAFGTSDLAFEVSGQVSSPTVGTFQGTTLQGPPATPNWVIQFVGVAETQASDYTLYVSDASGASNGVSNLDIKQIYCS